jgi:signal transduction protein with GAF and PtsI domain
MGPLVFEPLPVVVKAAETAEGRARLYQDSRAVERAARNLRAGTLSRLARHFNLGADATTEAILDTTARHVKLPATEVRSVLIDFMPESEGQLVQWAQQIERIEQEAIAR